MKKALLMFVTLLIACSPIEQTPIERTPTAPGLEPTPKLVPVGPPHTLGDLEFRRPDHVHMVYVMAHGFEIGSTDEQLSAALLLCPGTSAECSERLEREQPAHHVMLLRGF